MKQVLKIISCSDSLMWYRNKVGDVVDFLGEDDQYYWSREPAGYRNIIKKRDAFIMNVELNLDKDQIKYLLEIIDNTDCKSLTHTTYDRDLMQAVKQRIIDNLNEVL